MKKDLITISDLTKDEALSLITRARELKAMLKNGVIYQPLKGKSLAMIFAKSSTRTRVSFEVGMTQLGAHALFLSTEKTQMGRGEPICDTARVLSRYVDCVMIRTFEQSDVEDFAKFATIPVINGLTDMYHPCQVLCDLMTVQEKKDDFLNLKYAFIGDGASNMAHSWINAAATFGFELRIATPKKCMPNQALLNSARRGGAGSIIVTNDPKEAAQDADVINTDVWVSMGQEGDRNEKIKHFSGFQVDDALVGLCADDYIFLHCLPVHRGEEVSEDIFESAHSVVFDQAENRLHIQKSILLALLGVE